MTNNKCFWCGEEGKYQFQNGRWCCKEKHSRCPEYRKQSRIRHLEYNKNSKVGKLRTQLNNGELKCKYCGEPAKYILGNKTCCSPKASQCPSYNKWVGGRSRKRHREEPARRIKMVKAGIECQNRTAVKEKKSKTMKLLHRGDCDKCIEFQKSYEKGRIKFHETLKNRTT